MAITLRDVLEMGFQQRYLSGSCYLDCDEDTVCAELGIHRYMSIPIDKDVFEIPVIAFNSFYHLVKNDQGASYKSLVIDLYTRNFTSKYKSLSSIMKEALKQSFGTGRLIKVQEKEGDRLITYYVSSGTILSANFRPLLMCSWLIERHFDIEELKYKYKFLRPILRIAPDVYLIKGTPLERMIATKIPALCLESSISKMHCEAIEEAEDRTVRIEIDHCPFNVSKTANPSISISNKELCQLAIDHIKEAVQ